LARSFRALRTSARESLIARLPLRTLRRLSAISPFRSIPPTGLTAATDFPFPRPTVKWPPGEEVQNFIKHFVRESSGWRCVEPATLDLPSGRIQVNPGTVFTRGTSFMNVDLAKMLDEQYARDHR
jgi:hypothetical protein